MDASAPISLNSSDIIDLNSTLLTIDATDVSIDAYNSSNITMTANDANNKTLTIKASNTHSGSGTSTLKMESDDDIDIDATSGNIFIDAAGILDVDLNGNGSKIHLNGDNNDFWLGVMGGGTSNLMLTSNGTGSDAVNIDANAGGIDIDASATKDINISGGQVTLVLRIMCQTLFP